MSADLEDAEQETILEVGESKQRVLIIGGGSATQMLVRALVESGVALLSTTVLKPLEVPEIPSWALDLRCYDDYRMPESYGSPFSKDTRNRDHIQQKHAFAHKRRNVRKWR